MRNTPRFTRKTPAQPSSIAHGFRSIATVLLLLMLVSACGTATAPHDDEEIVLEYAQVRTQSGDVDAAADDNLMRLDGSTVSGTISIAVRASGRTDEVRFYTDDRDQRQRAGLVATQKPYVLDLDTKTLSDGPHTFTVTTVSSAGAPKTATGAFYVVNTLSSPVVSEP